MSPRCRYCRGQGRGHFPDEDGNEAGEHVVCLVCGGSGQQGTEDIPTGRYVAPELPSPPISWPHLYASWLVVGQTNHDQKGTS